MENYTKNYSHICEICGKAFSKKDHVRRHKLVHTGERPYICEICGTTFSHKSHLNRHRLIHTGKKL